MGGAGNSQGGPHHPHHLAKVPQMNDDTEIPYEDEVQKRRKSKSPKKAEQVELRQEINSRLEELNKAYAIVQRGSQVLVMREGINVNGEPTLSYMSTKDFGVRIAHNRVWDAENERYVGLANAWLTWEGRREYDEIYFKPDVEDRPRYYNLWRGFKCGPKPEGSCDIILDHIKSNICQNKPEQYAWVMAWLADIFQNPGRKPGTALVLRGEMGVGKGAFANHIGHLLGHHYCTVANGSQVTGRFNSHLAERILIFVDESFWSDEKYGAGILRALITEPRQPSEMKGRDLVMIDSFLRVMIAANDSWVVPVGMQDERRFTVLDVGSGVQRDIGYFTSMAEQLQNGGYEKLLHILLNHQYDKNAPRNILLTDALLDQKLYSMPDEAKWWHDCLSHGSITVGETYWPAPSLKVDDLYTSYSTWCDTMKVRHKLSKNSLSRALKKWTEIDRRKVTMDGWHYFVNDLGRSRELFEQAVGHNMDWSGARDGD